MSEWEDPDDSNGMKKLRKLVKEQGEMIASMKAREEQYALRDRASDINQALADRGLDPRVAKFYPGDAGTDDASVDKWVDENKDYFGNRRVVSEEGETDRSTLTDTEQRGYQVLTDIAAYESGIQQDFKSQIDKIPYDPQNPEKATSDLLALLKTFGVNQNMN